MANLKNTHKSCRKDSRKSSRKDSRKSCRKASRKASRKSCRKASRKNMKGGRRATKKFSFTLTNRVAKPLGVLAEGASNTIVTAGDSALKIFDSLVHGVVKTAKRATLTADKTVRAVVSRKGRKERKSRKERKDRKH